RFKFFVGSKVRLEFRTERIWRHKTQPYLIPVTLFVLALLFEPCRTVASTLEASVGRENLTPPLELKATLGGYGERMSKPAFGVHDAVWAKAVVFNEGERKFALVTADVLGFPP